MTDYISREMTIDAICRLCNANFEEDPCEQSECEMMSLLREIPAADVRPVVTCSDCKWWTKQESSLQGRCELLQMYPTGAWFCANGKREES